MSVRGTLVGITFLSQFHFGNIFQFQYFTIVCRTDYDFTEFLRSNPTPFELHGILISLIRILTERTGSRFDVLLGQHGSDIRRNQFILCHHIRFHPDTQTIVTTHNHHITHTTDTENLRFQVNTDIVGKKCLIVRVVRAMQREHLKNTRLTLAGGNTHLSHFCRKLPGGLRNTVLHIHRCHVGISTLFKIDRNGNRSRIRSRRGHISHVFHTVDGLFQRSNHTFLQSLCTGAEIAGGDHNSWRRNIRILFYGQGEQSDDADNDNRYGDDGG